MAAKQQQRLIASRAVGTLFALTLSACGGGGGGNAPTPVASAPAGAGGSGFTSPPSASGPAAPSPNQAPSGTPAAPSAPAAFVAFGPTPVATGLPSSAPGQPGRSAVARLAGGGAVTVWANDTRLLLAQRLDNAGAPAGVPIPVAIALTGIHGFDVAQLPDGGWVVVWSDSLPSDPGSGRVALQTLQFKRFSASGVLVQDTTDVAGQKFGLFGFHVRGTPDGGFAIVLSANESLFPPEVFLQRFDASGSKVGPAATSSGITENNGGELTPTLVALPDNTVELVWLRRSADNTQRRVYMQHFDARSAPLAGAVALDQTLQTGQDYDLAAAPLSDGRIGVTWNEILGPNPTPRQQFWLIADQAGAVQSPIGAMPVGRIIEGVAIAPAAGGGFTLFSQLSDQGSGPAVAVHESIGVLSVDNTGAAQGTWTTLVSRLAVAPSSGPINPAYSVAGGADGHYVVSYEEATAPASAQIDVIGK